MSHVRATKTVAAPAQRGAAGHNNNNPCTGRGNRSAANGKEQSGRDDDDGDASIALNTLMPHVSSQQPIAASTVVSTKLHTASSCVQLVPRRPVADAGSCWIIAAGFATNLVLVLHFELKLTRLSGKMLRYTTSDVIWLRNYLPVRFHLELAFP